MPVIQHLPLETVAYDRALDLQRRLHARRSEGTMGDLVLTLEHPPVLTLGRSGLRSNILVSSAALEEHGIEVFSVERGGDITYHGPGQLVAYPILDLRGHGKDVHRFVWALEEAILRVLAEHGIRAQRRHGFPGVWVEERKIASLGVYVKNWVTYHGLALNVQVNREHFRMIKPCGLPVEVVSVNDLLREPVSLSAIRQRLVEHLGAVLCCEVRQVCWQEVFDEPPPGMD